MIDFFLHIDVSVLYFINKGLSNTFFDYFFSFITNVKNWFPVYVVAILFLLIKGGKKGRFVAFFAIVLILLTDQINSHLLKGLFHRPRPFITFGDLNLPIGKPGGFSFPSSHSFNNFAMALYFGSRYRKSMLILLIIAFLIAFSRVYLGVHYPSDVIAGAILGSVFGFAYAKATRFTQNKFIK